MDYSPEEVTVDCDKQWVLSLMFGIFAGKKSRHAGGSRHARKVYYLTQIDPSSFSGNL